MQPDPVIPSPFACPWPKAQEEEWAANHSSVTSLFGWVLIAGVALSFVSSIAGNTVDLGGFALLVAGFFIKGGSQAWLRFATFVCGLVTLTGFGMLAASLLKGEPITLDLRTPRWVDYRHPEFWLLFVSPIMFVLAEFLLGLLCLHTRRLHFWTRPVRIWTWIVGGILILTVAPAVHDAWQRAERKRLAVAAAGPQLDTLRSLLRSRGTTTIRGSYPPLTAGLFDDNPRILNVSCSESPRMGYQLYDRERGKPTEPTQPAAITYREFVRGPGGTWHLLVLEFVPPD